MNNQVIKSIHLKNFASYKDTFVKFHPGVNVLVGANDAGKSNFRRAFDWVFDNAQPENNGFPLYWEGNPEVVIDIGGKLVGRYRSKTENLYTLTHTDGKKDVFKSFGQGVPQIIKDHLNISALNISSQWDIFFLLDKSAADVARHYNDLVNLTVIDTAIKNIAKTLKDEKTDLKIKEKVIEEKTEELKAYVWLVDAEADLSKLEKLNSYLKHLNSEWSELAGQIQQLQKLEELNKKYEEITKYKVHADVLMGKKEKIGGIKRDYVDLKNQKNNLESLNEQAKELKAITQYFDETNGLIKLANQIDNAVNQESTLMEYVDKLKQYQKDEKQYMDIIKFAPEAKALLVLNDLIEQGISKHDLLLESAEKRRLLMDTLLKWNNKHLALEREFNELMPDQCPLCLRGCNCGKI